MTIEQNAEAAMAKVIFATFDPWARPTANVPVPGMEQPAQSDGSYERHLRLVDDAAREVDEYQQRDADVVPFVRRRPWTGGAA